MPIIGTKHRIYDMILTSSNHSDHNGIENEIGCIWIVLSPVPWLHGVWLTSQLDMKMPEGPFTGQGLDTFDPIKKKFVAIWVDSMSATPVILDGNRSADGKKITMTGKGPAPDGTSTDYKTETEYVSKDKHIFKMWMGTTSGDPMMVATYNRKK